MRRMTHTAGGETYPVGDGVCPHGSLVCEQCAFDSGLRAALEAVKRLAREDPEGGYTAALGAIEALLIEAGKGRGK